MTNQTTTPHRTSVPWTQDAAAVGAAVVCALVLWGCAVTWGGVDLEVETGGGGVRRVTGPAVGVTAGLAALVGLVTLRALERITPRAGAWWAGLVLVVTLLSLAGPSLATSTAAVGTLVALHVQVAVVVVAAGLRSRRARRLLR